MHQNDYGYILVLELKPKGKYQILIIIVPRFFLKTIMKHVICINIKLESVDPGRLKRPDDVLDQSL